MTQLALSLPENPRVHLTFRPQLALIAIATLSALYVNFTQTLHKWPMAATSNEGSSLVLQSRQPQSPKITASFGIAPHAAETQDNRVADVYWPSKAIGGHSRSRPIQTYLVRFTQKRLRAARLRKKTIAYTEQKYC
jgi:hypothetical protein